MKKNKAWKEGVEEIPGASGERKELVRLACFANIIENEASTKLGMQHVNLTHTPHFHIDYCVN